MSRDVPQNDVISAERRDYLLGKVVDVIERYGLYTPAAFLFEVAKPLAFLGSQGMFMLAPIAGVFVDESSFEEFAHLLSDRENVERLLLMIEERERASRKKDKNPPRKIEKDPEE
ncbi:MAG: hypothetical protein ACOX18_09630 [Bacillota bacterium]|jgi:hypothetical protein